MRHFISLLLLVGGWISSTAWAAPGDLDTSFGMGGIVQTTRGAMTTEVGDNVLLQPDGRIIVAGINVEAGVYKFGLVRYLSDGSLDGSFGTGGFVTNPAGSAYGAISVALQPDGKILALGTIGTSMALVRYLSDGSLDPSFGSGGVATYGSWPLALPQGLVLQPSGKIVVLTWVVDGDTLDSVVARFDASGAIDPSFGTGGTVIFDLNQETVYVALDQILRQPDGKLIVMLTDPDGGSSVFRLDADGSGDPSFGTGGVLSDASRPIELDAAGRIYSLNDLTVTRYGANGVLDTTFGASGSVNHNCPYPRALGIQSDGRILVGSGIVFDALNYVARLDADGSMDTGFGGDGLIQIDYPLSTGGGFSSFAIQPDGKIVVAGSQVTDYYDYAVARLEGSVCGDGVFQNGEECEDGNLVDGDGCDSNCRVTGCGSRIITAGEQCDDGNVVDGDGCDSNCHFTGCGNGVVFFEGCDDGNLVDGDGCSALCLREGLYGKRLLLTKSPSSSAKDVFRATLDATPAYFIANSPSDPVQNGATLRLVATAGDLFDTTFNLPAANWSYIGNPSFPRGFSYKDPLMLSGPIRRIVFRTGRVIRISGRGSGLGHTLGTSPAPVSLELTAGSRNFCATFGGSVTFTTNRTYRAKASSAPELCPE